MENNNPNTIIKTAFRVIHIAVLVFFAYEIYLHATTGRPTSALLICFLVLTAPLKIFRNIKDRNLLKTDPKKLKAHDLVLLKCILLALLIVAVFVIITVIVAASKYR